MTSIIIIIIIIIIIKGEGVVEFSEAECYDNIRRKKNWSSPGPDKIANFWWKKLDLVKYVYPLFYRIINETIPAPEWYCRGRTVLIPKDGDWAHPKPTSHHMSNQHVQVVDVHYQDEI